MTPLELENQNTMDEPTLTLDKVLGANDLGSLGPSMPTDEVVQMSLPAVLCDELLFREIASIPNKLGFKIGDVAEILAVKQYILRYWESEFDFLRPKKAKNNQRIYTKKDVENAFLIRKLLHRDRFSIEGAKAALKSLKNHVRKEIRVTEQNEDVHVQIAAIQADIQKIKSLFQ